MDQDRNANLGYNGKRSVPAPQYGKRVDRRYQEDRPNDRLGERSNERVGEERRDYPRKQAFRLQVILEIDMELAYDLGNLILDASPTNPALLALAHQLVG